METENRTSFSLEHRRFAIVHKVLDQLFRTYQLAEPVGVVLRVLSIDRHAGVSLVADLGLGKGTAYG